MRSTFLRIAALAAAVLPAAAFAADNVSIKDGGNTSQCISAKDTGSSAGCSNPLVYRTIPTDGAGSNTETIKAGSTAAAAGDTSVVVGLSPNSPLPSGGNPIGIVQPGNTANTTPWLFTPSPATGNGWTPSLNNGLSTTVATVKGGAGELGSFMCINPNSTSAYIQIFDTSGSITLGTTAPSYFIPLPALQAFGFEWSNGVHMANAIKVAATTTATGSAAPTTALDCSFFYK